MRQVDTDAVHVVATYQVTRVVPEQGEPHRRLQHVQTVLLDVDEPSWPHVRVGNLISPVWTARSTGVPD